MSIPDVFRHLSSKINELPEHQAKFYTKSSIARWIFSSNAIEFLSTKDFDDTLVLVNDQISKLLNQQEELSSYFSGSSNPKIYVESTLKLFQQTYSDNTNISQHIFDEFTLKKWYACLVCEQALSHESVIARFALAAFAQYHFVTIHPFDDGNGRLCRFISKHLLDTFACSSYRDAYIDAITSGRNMDHIKKHQPLLSHLMQCAVEYYGNILKELSHQSEFLPTLAFYHAKKLDILLAQVRFLHEFAMYEDGICKIFNDLGVFESRYLVVEKRNARSFVESVCKEKSIFLKYDKQAIYAVK